MPSLQNDSSLNAKNSHVNSSRHSHNGLVLGFAITGGTIVIIAILLVCYIVYHKVKTRRTSPYDFTSIKLKRFSYRKLKAATNGFSIKNKIGQGGFGAVYKGVFRNGQQVAVKKLDTTSLQGEREFQNEVMVIGSISSPQIVSLVGFCADSKRRLLVYEYMQNGSLQEALFDEENPVSLDWRTRFKIILDVAQSLAFLHLNCDPPIIHGDVKPSNILLDANFSARLADFGLARPKTEVTGAEVRSEDAEGDSLEQERIRLERMARDKEMKTLRREAKRRKTEASNAYKNGEELEQHKEEVSNNLRHSSMHDEEGPPSPEIEGSPLNCLAINQTTAEHDKESAIQISDDGEKIAISPKDGFYVSHALTATQEFNISESKVEIDVSRTNSSQPGEGEDEISSKSSPVDEPLDENQLATPPGSGSGSSEHKETKDKGTWARDWWWKQDADESVRDYTVDWLAGEVRRGQSNTQNWIWREEVQHEEEARSNNKRNGGRERSMSLEWWGQFLMEMSCKDFQDMDRKRRRSKSKESTRGWLKENLSGEKSGEKSKELKNGEPIIKEKRREIREWWRDEYSEELSKKAKDFKKLDGKARKDFRANSMNRDSWTFDLSGELNPQGRGAHERQRESSKNKEWWSGDLLNWNRNRDSAGIEFSGEISGPIKDSRVQEGRRERSGSRDWCSVDLSSRALSSTSSMRGTVCYVAPEYGGGGILTEKSDVYSYGVLMLVIISGRRPLQVVATPAEFDRANLISWARNLAQTGKVLDLVDAALQGEYSKEQAFLCITLALLCLQRLPAVRPSMGEVVKILSGDLELPAFPFEFSPSPSFGHSTLSLPKKTKPVAERVNVELPLLA